MGFFEIVFCTLLDWLIYCIYIYTGKNIDGFDCIGRVEVWQVSVVQGSQFLHSFGTFDREEELMQVDWPQMKHVLAVRRKKILSYLLFV